MASNIKAALPVPLLTYLKSQDWKGGPLIDMQGKGLRQPGLKEVSTNYYWLVEIVKFSPSKVGGRDLKKEIYSEETFALRQTRLEGDHHRKDPAKISFPRTTPDSINARLPCFLPYFFAIFVISLLSSLVLTFRVSSLLTLQPRNMRNTMEIQQPNARTHSIKERSNMHSILHK